MKVWLVKGETRHEAAILGPDNYVRDLEQNIGHSVRMWLGYGWSLEPERMSNQPEDKR